PCGCQTLNDSVNNIFLASPRRRCNREGVHEDTADITVRNLVEDRNEFPRLANSVACASATVGGQVYVSSSSFFWSSWPSSAPEKRTIATYSSGPKIK